MVQAIRSSAEVLVFSSQHVSGEQLEQLSGIAAVLKFPCPELDDVDWEVEGEDEVNDADVL